MHTLYRALMAAMAYAQMLIVFALIGWIGSLVSGDWGPLVAISLWAAVFFAPMAGAQKWDEIGD